MLLPSPTTLPLSFLLPNMLDQAAKIENAFPISTVIKKRDIGGKFPDYYFE